MRLSTLISCLVLSLAACGEPAEEQTAQMTNPPAPPADTYSCDQRTAATPQPYCQQYEGLEMQHALEIYRGVCSGTWIVGGCPHADSLGGCRSAPDLGITITNWFYTDAARGYTSSAVVMAGCAQGKPGTFVAP